MYASSFSNSRTNLHSHQQCRNVPAAPSLRRDLASPPSFTSSFLLDVWWFHMHFHSTCEVEHLLLWLLAIYKSSLNHLWFKGLTSGSGMGKNPEMGQGKAVRTLGPPFY